MAAAEQSSKSKNKLTRQQTKGLRIVCYTLSLCLFVLAILLSVFCSHGYSQELDLSKFTYVGWDADGLPRGIIDVDAIISALRLPSPNDAHVSVEHYPDVAALCSMSLTLSYTEDETMMHCTVSCDVDTLKKYGIIVESLEWDQQIKGAVIEEPDSVAPSTKPLEPETTVHPLQTEQPKMDEGYIVRLLDKNDNGLNLRDVCQRVHDERDFLCKEIFGNNYSTTKTQVYFIVDTQQEDYVNLYRAVYQTTQKLDAAELDKGVEPDVFFFTVDIYDLRWTAEEKIVYGRVDVNMYNTQEEASSTSRFDSDRYRIDKLYGGGIVVKDKNLFDQNGFIRFGGYPTSYMMANGVMWSPSYDELSEDMIWSLTAVQGHSLANVLRYVRKEINARYYMAFSQTEENEFFVHFNQYSWYEAKEENWEDRMTETERYNIKLLRQIQSLVEN